MAARDIALATVALLASGVLIFVQPMDEKTSVLFGGGLALLALATVLVEF